MKKVIFISLLALLLFAVTGCGGGSESSPVIPTLSPNSTSTPSSSLIPSLKPTLTPTPSPSPSPSPSPLGPVTYHYSFMKQGSEYGRDGCHNYYYWFLPSYGTTGSNITIPDVGPIGERKRRNIGDLSDTSIANGNFKPLNYPIKVNYNVWFSSLGTYWGTDGYPTFTISLYDPQNPSWRGSSVKLEFHDGTKSGSYDIPAGKFAIVEIDTSCSWSIGLPLIQQQWWGCKCKVDMTYSSN